MSEQLVRTGIAFPSGTLKKIDEQRGRYYSRNRYMLKIIEEYLSETEQKQAQALGAANKKE
jgi:metal-responsive CopG/Arc/MetJ family transcriptional regulator